MKKPCAPVVLWPSPSAALLAYNLLKYGGFSYMECRGVAVTGKRQIQSPAHGPQTVAVFLSLFHPRPPSFSSLSLCLSPHLISISSLSYPTSFPYMLPSSHLIPLLYLPLRFHSSPLCVSVCPCPSSSPFLSASNARTPRV